MQLSEWRQHEARIDGEQQPDAPALIERLPIDFVAGLAPLDALALRHDPRAYLRARQLPPSDPDWLAWALVCGRSWGKSFAAAGWIVDRLLHDPGDYMLCAPKIQDVEDLQWSVIESLLPPWVRVVPRKSHGQVLLPDLGCRVFFHSADVTHARGKNLRGLWAEEPIAWPHTTGQTLWQNLRRSLRVAGDTPARAVITSTPPASLNHWLLPVLASPTTRVTRGTARDNPVTDPRNIEDWYREDSIESRRENDAEFVFGSDAALFRVEDIDAARVTRDAVPPMYRVVVSIDPATSDGKYADTTGVCAVGIAQRSIYVLASRVGRMHHDEWTRLAVDWAREYNAERYLVETTGTNDLVVGLLRAEIKRQDAMSRKIERIKAQGSKASRASGLTIDAKNGRLRLVGLHPELERDLTEWHPDANWSPGGLDSLTQAASFLTHEWKGNI